MSVSRDHEAPNPPSASASVAPRPPADATSPTARTWLAILINAGTALALALGVVGLAWSMLRDAALNPAALRTFGAGPESAHEATSAIQRALAGVVDAGTIMLASAVVLILTPILRVLVALLLFGRERDWTYVCICLIVLAGLALGAAGIVK